jgi:hypothetical protein
MPGMQTIFYSPSSPYVSELFFRDEFEILSNINLSGLIVSPAIHNYEMHE